MDPTLQQCERELFHEYQNKVQTLNERVGESKYKLVHIRGKSGVRDLRVQLQDGPVVSLSHIDRKLTSSRRNVKENNQPGTGGTDLEKILLETIQLTKRYKSQLKLLSL
jgi:hypothetical protein